MARITNINELGDIKTYSCGSQRLSHNIKTKLGIYPINVYRNKNHKIINVFVLTTELSNYLKEWSNNNPNKNKGGVLNG